MGLGDLRIQSSENPEPAAKRPSTELRMKNLEFSEARYGDLRTRSTVRAKSMRERKRKLRKILGTVPMIRPREMSHASYKLRRRVMTDTLLYAHSMRAVRGIVRECPIPSILVHKGNHASVWILIAVGHVRGLDSGLKNIRRTQALRVSTIAPPCLQQKITEDPQCP